MAFVLSRPKHDEAVFRMGHPEFLQNERPAECSGGPLVYWRLTKVQVNEATGKRSLCCGSKKLIRRRKRAKHGRHPVSAS